MQALSIIPGKANSAALIDMPELPRADGPVLVRTLVIGVCGTDTEIVSGAYGWAPPGEERLVLGHESLGQVIEAPGDSGFAAGDLVVGVVRRPDPLPCIACGIGEWDMCRNDGYTERGIKQRHGYVSERFRIESRFLVKLDPALGTDGVLLEPTSVVAKAWEQVDKIGARGAFQPRTALVTGAGPIGLLAAMIGVQKGLDVHVLDRATGGAKPRLVAALGARYHAGAIADIGVAPDIVVECTGAASLVLDAAEHLAPYGILCLAGLSAEGSKTPVDLGRLNRDIVLENRVVFGSVNANHRHYAAAAAALSRADRRWLDQLISRRVPLARWSEALARRPDDIKVVVDFSG
jgi:glucose 1-dehydrogenase